MSAEEAKTPPKAHVATNAIPKGAYRFKWKRTGDDGAVEEGVEPLESKKFSVKTKTSKPGFVRMTAELVDKEDKPFTKLIFRGGAPIYLDAGYDLPRPTSYPWCYLVDQKGILRYSGNKLERLGSVREQEAQ